VLNADRLAPECIQTLRPRTFNHYYGAMGTNEDCLYLNVWAPSDAKAGKKYPVIFWVHGGGWTIGSGSVPLYDGSNIAKHGAVFVSINYRLGLLGFMAHPELTAESPQHASGNYGYLDMVAALQWVKRNISGVVGMSGNVWINSDVKVPSLADAEKAGEQLQQALKLHSVAELRNVPADRIVAMQDDCQLGCSSGNIRTLGIAVDGHFLTDQPTRLMEQNHGGGVPVVVGFANDEDRGDFSAVAGLKDFQEVARRTFGVDAAQFLQLYPATSDGEARSQAHVAAREAGQLTMARNWALHQARVSHAPVYIYNMVHVQPFNSAVEMTDHPERIGAYHTSDVPYWLGTMDALTMLRPTRLWGEADHALAEAMMESLVTFAGTGNPATARIPWKPWAAGAEQLVLLDTNRQMEAVSTARLEFHLAHRPPPMVLASPGRPRD
jgi:para-nitrobenzyl esterase